MPESDAALYRAGVGQNFASRATSGFQNSMEGRTDFF